MAIIFICNFTHPVVVEALHGREGGALAGVRLVAADAPSGGAHGHSGEDDQLQHFVRRYGGKLELCLNVFTVKARSGLISLRQKRQTFITKLACRKPPPVFAMRQTDMDTRPMGSQWGGATSALFACQLEPREKTSDSEPKTTASNLERSSLVRKQQ